MRDEDVAVLQQALLEMAQSMKESNRLLKLATEEMRDIRRAIEEIG